MPAKRACGASPEGCLLRPDSHMDDMDESKFYAGDADFVHICAVDVVPGRMTVTVRCHPPYSSPGLADLLIRQNPGLPWHSCRNPVGLTFGHVIEGTSTAHILEHLIIDDQVGMSLKDSGSDSIFLGDTQWLDERRGLSLIEVSFRSDAMALAALKSAKVKLESCLRMLYH